MGQCWTCGEPVSFLLSIWRLAVERNRASSEGVRTMEVMPGVRPSTVACQTRLNRRLSASRSKMLTLPLLHPAAKPCRATAHPLPTTVMGCPVMLTRHVARCFASVPVDVCSEYTYCTV